MKVLLKEVKEMLRFNKEGEKEISPKYLASIWLMSQTVLLRGRNQSPSDIKTLGYLHI